jgi:type II secretory ATPase GspE/PulE/Tfp pilus assembly ATPase PilB-like protein
MPPGSDENLSTVLVQNGLLTEAQFTMARDYARDHHCDVCQAILELNLIPPDRLNTLAFERIVGLARGEAMPGLAALHSLQPDRAKIERDIRAELKATATTATPPDLLDQVIERAFDSMATDIHLDPLVVGYRVRYRIDGQLHEIVTLEPEMALALIARIKVLSNLRIVERRHAQDGLWITKHAGRPHTLRISTIPTEFGERVVLRIHEALTTDLGFHQLGLQQAQVEQLRKLIERPYGAILVGGPVGAGKTTTLYSCLRHLNHPSRNLMTIEDPIEYRIPGINQVGISTHPNGITFGEGLRAILRQDPDVLMIGEVRSKITARVNIRAALTGVLVLSTIHSADAASTAVAMFNYGVPAQLLSSALMGVISQRLVRRICPHCRIGHAASAAELAALGLDPAEHDGLTLYRGQGCRACFQTGYLGQTAIFEIFEVNELIRTLILSRTTREVIELTAKDEGMKTMRQCAIDKILEGLTTVDELHRLSI